MTEALLQHSAAAANRARRQRRHGGGCVPYRDRVRAGQTLKRGAHAVTSRCFTRGVWSLCSIALVLAVGCGGGGDNGRGKSSTSAKPSTPTPKATAGYPSSIAVLGHSGATGENSDPSKPGVEVRANSWATGTNPEVKSLYQRLLAKNPAIKGHNVNLAQSAATVTISLAKRKTRSN